MPSTRRSPWRFPIALALAVLPACRHHSSPAAAEMPAPTPAPPAPARALGCGLPPGGGSGEDCPQESPSFMAGGEQAIDLAIFEHPEMFNTQPARGSANCYQVLETHNFPDEGGRNLAKRG